MASVDRWQGNRWRVRYRTPAGESRSKVFDRKAEAEKFRTSVEHSRLTGAYVDLRKGRTTVAEYWALWSKRQPWRASSRTSVTSLFDNHVAPALGGYPLNGLRRGDVEAWAARLERKRADGTRVPLAARTANQAAQWLSTMLESAVLDGLIAVNPARGAKRPRIDVEPVVPFTDGEVDALRSAAPAWFTVALDLGLGAGLRQSEATGLTVDRVDFLRRQLTVDRQLVTPLAGDPTLGPPKTKRSYRTIPLADAVVEALSAHIAEHGTGQHGLLLHGLDGRPVRKQRFGSVWRKLRGEAEMPTARFHDTRHSYASVLLSGGVSVAAAADYLGHTPGELLRTYAHMMPADHDRARSVVQSAFDRDTSGVTTVSRAATD
jgi:integrase